MELTNQRMKEKPKKYNIPVITAEVYNLSPERYELRKGTLPDAPPCPFGHRFKWIGFDKNEMKYVRVTKSVFKRMIKLLDEKVVEEHEAYFEKIKENE